MKQITKFQAFDGSEFTTEKECLDYDSLINRVNNIMSFLKPLPSDKSCDFSNGHSFIQQKKSDFDLVKLKLLNVAKEHISHKWVQQTIDDENVHLSYVGRLVSESDLRPLNAAWYRLMCIDKEYREWGQPYFANNPQESPALKGQLT